MFKKNNTSRITDNARKRTTENSGKPELWDGFDPNLAIQTDCAFERKVLAEGKENRGFV